MRIIRSFQKFVRTLGPVEQAQVVASTAVVVSMITIISAMAATRQSPRLMDFISILTVGLFGLVTVTFSLRYGRQMDAQQRHLLALNSLADTLSQITDPQFVLESALKKVMGFFDTPSGWVYMIQGERISLSIARGTTGDFLGASGISRESLATWCAAPHLTRERVSDAGGAISQELKNQGIQFWATIPFSIENSLAGFLAVAGPTYSRAQPSQFELVQALGNQISVALTNAWLFEQLTRSRRQYADLFENAPDIYLSVSSDGTILDCNTTGAKMLNAGKTDIIGRKIEEWFAADRRAAVRSSFEQMLSRRDAIRDEEETMEDAAGRRFSVLLNSSLVLDSEGRMVTARVVARDITERKKMEAAILHAQKLDSIGNLAGGIAHDFNNLLAAVLGSANIMRRQMGEDERLKKYLDIVESSARRGSTLTRQLLTFARKTERQVNAIDVNAIVNDTLALFQRGADKRMTVETALSTESLTTNGDEGQIQQAVLNLFANARDAMPDGGVLRIETGAIFADGHITHEFSSVRPGPFVTIRVSDTGSGIPRELQGRVFEPFFSTKDHGTGLGLSVVYGVVQSHGGFINLESLPGSGTSVTLFLPRLAVKPPASRTKQTLPRGTEEILIIDDEDSVSEIARDMLVSLGYTVYVENDGRAGVNFFRTRNASVRLVLLDVNMPVLGGKEAFAELRKIDPSSRIVIVTGYGRGTIETADFGSQVNAFMQKPFQMETLAMTVRHVLDEVPTRIDPDKPDTAGST
ncbi:MAG: ATP-binding protein [Bacteroidota bacterium]